MNGGTEKPMSECWGYTYSVPLFDGSSVPLFISSVIIYRIPEFAYQSKIFTCISFPKPLIFKTMKISTQNIISLSLRRRRPLGA